MKLLIHLLMLIDCGTNLIVYLVWKHAVRRVNGSVRISPITQLMILNSGTVQIRKEQMYIEHVDIYVWQRHTAKELLTISCRYPTNIYIILYLLNYDNHCIVRYI